MSLVQLNDDALPTVAALVDDPSRALPLALLARPATENGAVSSDWTWSASVEAGASLAIDLLTDADLRALPVRPDAGHALVVYGVAASAGGKLGADAATLPSGQAGLDAGETWLGIGVLGARDEPVAWPFTSSITTMAQRSWPGCPCRPDSRRSRRRATSRRCG